MDIYLHGYSIHGVFHPVMQGCHDNRNYAFLDFGKPFMENGRATDVFVQSIRPGTALWVRDMVAEGGVLRLVLVLERAGLPELTMALESDESWAL